MQKDKCWSKLGKVGDPLIVQILLKKQSSGLWRLKKLVVTCDPPKTAPPAAQMPPRITCADEEAGADLLDCARYGDAEVLRDMLGDASVPVDFQNEGYNTALHYASANGHVDCVEVLLDRGARHLPNAAGNTPLHWAVQNKHAVVVRSLLARAPGADELMRE